MSKLTEWLDNPFRTIIEFTELKAVRGETVISSLGTLKELMTNTPAKNEVAEVRITKAIDFVKEKFSEETLNDTDPIVQGGIIVVMKLKLKE